MGVWLLLFLLIVWSICDLKEGWIPIWLLVVGGFVTLGNAIYQIIMGQATWLQLLLGTLPGIFLLIVAWLSGKAGYADGIILLFVGMMQGYKNCLVILCVSLLLISVVSIILLLLRKVKRDTRLPYVPFIMAAFFITNSIVGGQ